MIGKRRGRIKSNFLFIIREVLSSGEELCRGIDIMAKENKILRRSRRDRYRLVDMIIKKRADVSKGVGIAANAPSAIPLVGVLGMTAFTSAVEFISLVRLQIEMCLEIAYVYGKGPDPDRLIEALAIIGWHYDNKDRARLDEAALKSGVKKAVKSYAKKGMLLVIERLAMRIELAAFKKSLPRFIPLLGMPIAAGMNFRESMAVGRLARMYYS